jgi:hypothetical protein
MIRPDIILRARLNRWEHAGAEPQTAASAALRAEYRCLVGEAAGTTEQELRMVAGLAVARRDRTLYNFACEAFQAQKEAA